MQSFTYFSVMYKFTNRHFNRENLYQDPRGAYIKDLDMEVEPKQEIQMIPPVNLNLGTSGKFAYTNLIAPVVPRADPSSLSVNSGRKSSNGKCLFFSNSKIMLCYLAFPYEFTH